MQKYSTAAKSASRPSITITIAQYIELRRSGKEFIACCPFHDDRHPSLSVNDDKAYSIASGAVSVATSSNSFN